MNKEIYKRLLQARMERERKIGRPIRCIINSNAKQRQYNREHNWDRADFNSGSPGSRWFAYADHRPDQEQRAWYPGMKVAKKGGGTCTLVKVVGQHYKTGQLQFDIDEDGTTGTAWSDQLSKI